MNKYKKLAKNIGFFTVANLASKVLTFLLLPLYTAILSTEEYGTADIITITISLVFPLLTLCLNESMMRFAIDENDKRTIFSFGICINFIGVIILSILLPISNTIPTIGEYYLYFIFYYFSYALYNAISYFAQGAGQVKQSAYIGVLNTALAIVFNIYFLAVLNLGLVGYLLAYCLSFSISAVVLFFGGKYYKLIIPPSRFDKELCKKMLQYSLPMVPNSVSWWISNSSDKYMMTLFVGISATGVYSIAYKIPTIFSIFSNLFIGAWKLSAAEEFNKVETSSFYNKIFQMYLSSSFIIVGALITTTKTLASILFSKDFYSAYLFVPILLLSAFMHGICEFYGVIYTSAKKTERLFISSILGAVLNILLNLLLIPLIGGIGAAFATFASYCAIVAFRVIDTKKYIKLEIFKLNNFTSFLLLCIGVSINLINVNYGYIMLIGILIIISFINRNIVIIICEFMATKIKEVRIIERKSNND
jgi:O-antigen/teichoic acid export membrane protein